MVEGGGGRSEALSRLAGGMERARRRRGGRFKVQRGHMVRGGVLREGGRRWDENRWLISLGQKKGHPFLPERRGGVRGMLKGLRMVKFESEKEKCVKETHFFSQVGERSFVGVMGLWSWECESIGTITLGTLTQSPRDGHLAQMTEVRWWTLLVGLGT